MVIPSKLGSHLRYGWPHPVLLAAPVSALRQTSRTTVASDCPFVVLALPRVPSRDTRGWQTGGLATQRARSNEAKCSLGPSPRVGTTCRKPTRRGLQTALRKNFSLLKGSFAAR
jgi:hypothetical protein